MRRGLLILGVEWSSEKVKGAQSATELQTYKLASCKVLSFNSELETILIDKDLVLGEYELGFLGFNITVGTRVHFALGRLKGCNFFANSNF